MKSLRYLTTAVLILSLAGYSACKKKNPGPKGPTEQQQQAQKLAGTWNTSSVDASPTGVDPSLINTLTMTFNVDNENNPTSFSASNAPEYFSTLSSSAWSFSGTSTTVINLSNVTPVTSFDITDLSGTTLKIHFTFVTPQRTQKLDGDYNLTLTKQ